MFELIPILDKMIELYEMPRNQERFKKYLNMLQGDTAADMIIPIASYNPMGNDYVLQRIQELKEMKAESILQDVIEDVNSEYSKNEEDAYKVVINVIDDLGGAWSQYCTTDYTQRFKLSPLIKRNFCTPYYWTSESYDEDLLKVRALRQMNRTIYQIKNGSPKTLQEHIHQELLINKNINASNNLENLIELDNIKGFFNTHRESEDYALIFNFLYGDVASKAMGYKCWGIGENGGNLFISAMSET